LLSSKVLQILHFKFVKPFPSIWALLNLCEFLQPLSHR